ncbi:MAG: PH domain-containing protein [Gaiellales bacterium]
MGGYADKLQKKAGEVLRPDEKLISAVRAAPRGSTTGMAVGGLVGMAVASRQAKKAHEQLGEGTLASSWPQGQAAVGLTDQRILTFNYTAMGKPKDLTGEFPLDQISSVDMEKKKLVNALSFGFVDGSVMVVECKKLEKADDFIAAFRGVKGA